MASVVCAASSFTQEGNYFAVKHVRNDHVTCVMIHLRRGLYHSVR
jgi:hypothetical protein